MLSFIAAFYDQLQQFPEDFFFDELSKENFLCECFQTLKFYISESKIGKAAIKRLTKLLELVRNKFKYEVEENEEDFPVIVDEYESYF